MVNRLQIARILMGLSLLLAPALAAAQGAVAGAIAGIVRDTTGAVLPGATVEASSPVLIEKVRSAVSDEEGRYQIAQLRPGTYTLAVTLPGFGTVRREGIELTTGFTATINVELSVGNVEEAVTVSGVTPLVDTRNVVKQTTLSDQTLDALPTARTMGSYASLLPAAKSQNANDMGGIQGERGGGFGVHGGSSQEINVNQDGLNVTMLNSSVYSYNPSAAQEIVIEVSGTSAESFSAGARVNVVMKEGSNRFSGELFGNNSGLQSENLSDDLRARNLFATPSIKKNYTVEGSFGGPIRQDKLWFFTAHRWWVANSFIPGNFYNKLNGTIFYAPDTDRPFSTQDYFRDHTVRLTSQVTQRDKVNFAISIQDNCTCPLTTTVRPEASGNHFYMPSMQATATWTRPITSHLLLETAVGRNYTAIHAKPGPEHVDNAIAVLDTGLGFLYGSRSSTGNTTVAGHSENYGVGTKNELRSARAAVSYVTGAHNFKIGGNVGYYTNGNNQRDNVEMIPNAVRYTFRNQSPLSVRMYATPWGRASKSLYTGAFVQDQWTISKLTVNAGLRYDGHSAVATAQSFAAGRFVGAREFPEVRNVPNWKNVNPRVGVAYDLFGTGKTILKASMGRYVLGVSSIGNNGLALDQPINSQALFADRTWNDSLFGPGDPRTGNFVPDCVLGPELPEANGECGAISNTNFGKVLESHPNSRTSDDVLRGFQSAQEYLWQGDATIEHEILPGLSVNAGYFRATYGNLRVLDNQRIEPTDFNEYCITAPSDSRLPGGGANEICGLWDIQPGKFGQTFNLTAMAEDYGKRSQVYNGVDINVRSRFGQGGVLQGGVSTGSMTTDNCFVVDSPQASGDASTQSGLFNCRVSPPWSSSTNAKFLVVYPLPWDFRASVVYQNLPGIPIEANHTARNAEIRPTLGRDLGSCRGAATCNGTTTVALIAPQSVFEDRRHRTDLRFSRSFRVRGIRLDGSLDVYNLFNANDVLAMITDYGTSWQNVNEIVAGRFMKFGLRASF